MNRDLRVSLFDLTTSLSNAMDLISPDIVNHHKRVAYIALKIAKQMKLPTTEINTIVLAGILHDIGALSFQDRVLARQYEFTHANKHAELGYLLLKNFQQMHDVSKIVRHHHVPWEAGNGANHMDEAVPIGSHIIHLADRVEILINRGKEILGQVERIVKVINNGNNKMYNPEVIAAFSELINKEYFWLDVTSPNIGQILAQNTEISQVQLEMNDLLEFTKVFSQIIDFRSSFTAAHSSGVAHTSEALAKYVGLSERECQMMRIAGYLHDLGKLAIPTEILEKPDGLLNQEFNVIRSHTYHTYRVLDGIPGFDQITEWASLHHEKLDGTGYPFRHTEKDISLGARIMAVADVFTAITEDRPYRSGLEKEKVLNILNSMVQNNALDNHIVRILDKHYETINEIRIQAQTEAQNSYKDFGKRVDAC